MLHESLRLIRQFHALTQSQLAQKLDISKSFLSEVEHGHKNITLDLLQRYAEVFDMPRSHLLLFAEQVEGAGNATTIKIAGKALRILKWVEALTRDERAEEMEKV